ncbi:MAG: Lrp/AsnC family transcriptional regulator [DPANN group archaeon]|nr:Lrp/AsnC family transcriptional regulator [DPANN group archaeon]
MDLSDNEKKILLYLFDNPLATNHTIATYMNIHHATVSAIRKKLEETAGLSYKVDINPKKAGLDGVYVIYFSLNPASRGEKEFSAFVTMVQNIEGVIGVGLVTNSVWDGWFRVISNPFDSDRIFFILKRKIGSYVDKIEIIKYADARESGAQNMNKLIEML